MQAKNSKFVDPKSIDLALIEVILPRLEKLLEAVIAIYSRDSLLVDLHIRQHGDHEQGHDKILLNYQIDEANSEHYYRQLQLAVSSARNLSAQVSDWYNYCEKNRARRYLTFWFWHTLCQIPLLCWLIKDPTQQQRINLEIYESQILQKITTSYFQIIYLNALEIEEYIKSRDSQS